jgi:hypothetical protein
LFLEDLSWLWAAPLQVEGGLGFPLVNEAVEWGQGRKKLQVKGKERKTEEGRRGERRTGRRGLGPRCGERESGGLGPGGDRQGKTGFSQMQLQGLQLMGLPREIPERLVSAGDVSTQMAQQIVGALGSRMGPSHPS